MFQQTGFNTLPTVMISFISFLFKNSLIANLLSLNYFVNMVFICIN